MFEQTFKNIDDILHKDAGCSSELDYVEQTSWVLFLKYLDDFEKDRRTKAELAGKTYEDLISKQYRWDVWAAPKSPPLKGEAGRGPLITTKHSPVMTSKILWMANSFLI
jgi:hypothetical protein